MDRVFIYWDNSNIYHGAQSLAEEIDGTPGAANLVRVDFDKIIKLARAGRPIKKAIVAGSVTPSVREVWNRLKASGTKIRIYDRNELGGTERQMPDYYLRKCMVEDSIEYAKEPGIAVLLTGDGDGYMQGKGFHTILERLHDLGWRIEVLSWEDSCKKRMRKWVENNGIFVALDDFYRSITFLEPSRPGHDHALARDAAPLDLSRRDKV